ncbi:hypothetical protein QHL1GM_11665 [Halomonas sp. QHL1]|nr:hypothetical protein QHL1GM_11665 [Halomonas sp. QHL1]
MQTQIEKEIMRFMESFSKEYEEKEEALNVSLEEFFELLDRVLENQKNMEKNYSTITESYEIILKNFESLDERVKIIEQTHKELLTS